MHTVKQTILVVDDAVSNIEILNGILDTDYEILFATCGKDALEIAREQMPDLILLDIVMPDMDGYEVCTRLKTNVTTQEIPVVFITAMGQEEDESRGLNIGAIDYITKPIRASIVKARLRNHLELKRYRDSLKTLSTVDGLTGVANRRRFDEVLSQEWLRARRNLSPVSLLMMDIDFFKAYNDHYGHLAGDDCLRKVAEGLNEVARRPADILARYGGEEFVLLLPETDAEGGLKIAQRAQEKMQHLNIPHAYSIVAKQVTLSIGVATIVPSDEQTFHELILRSDELLYEAKHGGRNQVRSHSKQLLVK
jgi:diguanylate cyclase (GGDEF)-like protein